MRWLFGCGVLRQDRFGGRRVRRRLLPEVFGELFDHIELPLAAELRRRDLGQRERIGRFVCVALVRHVPRQWGRPRPVMTVPVQKTRNATPSAMCNFRLCILPVASMTGNISVAGTEKQR